MKKDWGGAAAEGGGARNDKGDKAAKRAKELKSTTEKYVNKTPTGEYKVDIAEPMAKNYNFEAVESAWCDHRTSVINTDPVAVQVRLVGERRSLQTRRL